MQNKQKREVGTIFISTGNTVCERPQLVSVECATRYKYTWHQGDKIPKGPVVAITWKQNLLKVPLSVSADYHELIICRIVVVTRCSLIVFHEYCVHELQLCPPANSSISRRARKENLRGHRDLYSF